MTEQNRTNHHWSIFASELKRILNKYDMDLGQLDDRMGIHREKVRRLIRSLQTPASLPMLNPEDTQVIIDTLQLDGEDVLQLRAAVLATAVQRMLSDRIHQDDARLAAEQILPTITQALIEHAGERGLGNTRGDIDPIEDGELDDALDSIVNTLDRGSEALQLSESAGSYGERVKKARHAQSYYEDALAELESLPRAIQKQLAWQNWYNETRYGLALTKARRAKLGD